MKIEEFSVKSVMCSFKKIFIPMDPPPTRGRHFCFRPILWHFCNFPTYLGTPCMKRTFPKKIPLHYTFVQKIIFCKIKRGKFHDTTILIPFLAKRFLVKSVTVETPSFSSSRLRRLCAWFTPWVTLQGKIIRLLVV